MPGLATPDRRLISLIAYPKYFIRQPINTRSDITNIRLESSQLTSYNDPVVFVQFTCYLLTEERISISEEQHARTELKIQFRDNDRAALKSDRFSN